MKVIAVEWTHSGEKATFYFSSEERIDFRALVKELAQRFRVRVEMRQVGPRDEAKIIGAMGPCGRETCCSSWMRAFTPVSIKMAKDQGLSITPAKVTGVCGRLLCCLAYEQDTYRDLRRKLPRVGKQVVTPRGPGRIVDLLVLREYVRVQLDSGEGWEDFPAADVRPVGPAAPLEEPENEADAGDVVPEEVPSRPLPPPAAQLAPPRDVPRPQAREDRRPPRREDRPPRRDQPRPAAPPPHPPEAPKPTSAQNAAPEGGGRHRNRRRGRGGGGSPPSGGGEGPNHG
jgi:hypothetical protein